MARAHAGVRFLRPRQISSCFPEYNTTHSARSHVQTYTKRDTAHRTPRRRTDGRTDGRTDDGKESAKVERESAAAAAAAHSQLRIIRIPSGRPTAKAAPPRPVRRVPPSPAAALPCCRRLTRADHVFAREGRREGGKKGEPPSISIISGLISALPTKLLRSTSDRLLC